MTRMRLQMRAVANLGVVTAVAVTFCAVTTS
jgi:hypothetical protein